MIGSKHKTPYEGSHVPLHFGNWEVVAHDANWHFVGCASWTSTTTKCTIMGEHLAKEKNR
jgi:hypothetical protein